MVDLRQWRPPEGFIPAASSVEGVRVFAPAPPPEEVKLPETFTCERCGNQSRYAAGQGATLVCEHCSSRKAITQVSVEAVEEKAEFRLSTLDELSRGWGADEKEVQCKACGATVIVEPRVVVTACSFCESQQVVSQAASQEGMRPTAVLPFTVDEVGALDLIKGWLARGDYRPPDLPRAASTLKLHGVYLPYWVFDANIIANWRCEVGRKVRRGDKTVTEWHPRSGVARLTEAGDLERGLDGLDTELLEQIEPFPLDELVDYLPSFLAGWQTRPAKVTLEDAFERARHQWRIKGSQAGQAQIDEKPVRNYVADITYEEERWRYVLLPVWVGSYTYGEESFSVLINGRTAELAGRRPVEHKKILKQGAVATVPGLAAFLYGTVHPSYPGLSNTRFFNDASSWTEIGGLWMFVAVVYFTHLYNKLRRDTSEL